MIELILGVGIGLVAGTIVTLIAVSSGRKDDNFSCAGCQHINVMFDFEEPCVHCKRTYEDRWEGTQNE